MARMTKNAYYTKIDHPIKRTYLVYLVDLVYLVSSSLGADKPDGLNGPMA